ncbi:MAG: porin [Rhizobiaceae bacterium]
MKLKSLLMGSAAALISAPVAFAANAPDAVTAEPEPVEHVRVCDMYGTGFFYIPGTERCLVITGELRVQYQYQETDGEGDGAEGSSGEGTWYGRVNFDAKEETDHGTLRSYVRMESTTGTNASEGDVHVRDAYIELGGFSTGYRTSRAELTGLPGQMFDGSYHGGGRVMYADYTFAANGLAVISGVSLDNEDDGSAESVDFYFRADYSTDMFSFGGVVANDSSTEESAFGVYATLTPADGLTLQGYFNDQSGMTQFGSVDSEDHTRWGIGASYGVTDAITLAAGYYGGEGGEGGNDDELEAFSLNLAWTVAENLVVQLGYNHEEVESVDGDTEEDNMRVRIQRNF